jgi:hypothetical protein
MELSPAMATAMREQPALPWPGGPNPTWEPKLHSPEQAWYYVCVTLCAVVSGVFIMLRLYTKLRIVRALDLSDCLFPPLTCLTFTLSNIKNSFDNDLLCKPCQVVFYQSRTF